MLIINIVVGFSKHNDELQHAQVEQVENMIASNEIETRRGANQIGTFQRAGDTRWGSHFQSICSLIRMLMLLAKLSILSLRKGLTINNAVMPRELIRY